MRRRNLPRVTVLLSIEEHENLDPTSTQAFFLLIFSSSRAGSELGLSVGSIPFNC